MRTKNLKLVITFVFIVGIMLMVVACGQETESTSVKTSGNGNFNQQSGQQPSDSSVNQDSSYGTDSSVMDLGPEEALEWYIQQPDLVPKEKYQFGASLVYLSDPLWVAFQYGIEQQLKDLGLPMPYVTAAGGYTKGVEQIAQVEDLLVRGIDGLLLGPADPDALVPAVEQATNNGVPVVNFAVGINTDKIVTDVEATQELLGQRTAEYLGAELDGKGKVYMLSGVAGSSWAVGREEGFINYITENHPDIEIVDKHYSANDRSIGLNHVQDALQAHPDIDAVYAGADILAQGAADAIKAAGKTGEIKVVTMAGIGQVTQEMIRNGEITMSLPYQAVEQGRMVVNLMVRYLNGDKNIPKQFGVPVETIDQNNIDSIDIQKYLAPENYTPNLAQ